MTYKRKNIYYHIKVKLFLFRHIDEKSNVTKIDSNIKIKKWFNKIKKIILIIIITQTEINTIHVEKLKIKN